MCFFKNKKKKKADITLKKTFKEQKKNPVAVENKKTETKKSAEPIKNPAIETVDVDDDTVEAPQQIQANRYHISQNKDENSEHFKEWRVRKEGSEKTIKFFSTQSEAIEYADNLTKTNGGHIIIHKVDGKVRKQYY